MRNRKVLGSVVLRAKGEVTSFPAAPLRVSLPSLLPTRHSPVQRPRLYLFAALKEEKRGRERERRRGRPLNLYDSAPSSSCALCNAGARRSSVFWLHEPIYLSTKLLYKNAHFAGFYFSWAEQRRENWKLNYWRGGQNYSSREHLHPSVLLYFCIEIQLKKDPFRNYYITSH